MHYTVIMSQVGCETCFMFKEFYCVIFFVSESDFSMYGMMFLSFQSNICALNLFYPNMLKCCSFSIMTFPEECVQLFSKFATIVECYCSSQASTMCFYPCSYFSCVQKIAKSDFSFVIADRLSVDMEELGSHWTDFHEIWYFEFFFNLLRNFKFIKLWQEEQVLYMKSNVHFLSYLAELFLEWEMF